MRLRAIRVWCVVATAVAGTLATVATPAAALGANLLADPGFESAGSGWTPDSWGTNDAALDLVPDAHSGATAARVTITDYTDGDAKWLPDPVAVTPGTTYIYDDWYRAGAATELWAQFATSTGALSYVHLAGVAAAPVWTATERRGRGARVGGLGAGVPRPRRRGHAARRRRGTDRGHPLCACDGERRTERLLRRRLSAIGSRRPGRLDG